MSHVREIMHSDVPTISADATVLEAAHAMNQQESSGIAVLDRKNEVVGVITDRRLLMTFFSMNKPPAQVRVSEVMAPFYRIGPEATPKEAARKIVENGVTRLGVFEDKKFLGWVTLTDLSRHFSRKGLLEVLVSHNRPEPSEFLCPNCKSAFMRKVTNEKGDVLHWQCPRCGEVL